MKRFLLILCGFLTAVAFQPAPVAAGCGGGDCNKSSCNAHACGEHSCDDTACTTGVSDGDVFYYTRVRGKRGRKYVRHFLLRKNLTNDKKAVFEEYGFTPHRLRFNHAGRITERWTYHQHGVEFLFDSDSNIIEQRRVPVEDRRVNVYSRW